MADKQPRSTVEIRDFPGLFNNGDPTDLPPGAAIEQLNVTSQTPGELAVRRGYRDLTFESLAAGAAASSALTILPAGITSAEVFGTPLLQLPQTVAPTGIATAEAFGEPQVTVNPGS